jgi:hypothetical protein
VVQTEEKISRSLTFLYEHLPENWIGRVGPVPWTPRSVILDILFWSLAKDDIYKPPKARFLAEFL